MYLLPDDRRAPFPNSFIFCGSMLIDLHSILEDQTASRWQGSALSLCLTLDPVQPGLALIMRIYILQRSFRAFLTPRWPTPTAWFYMARSLEIPEVVNIMAPRLSRTMPRTLVERLATSMKKPATGRAGMTDDARLEPKS